MVGDEIIETKYLIGDKIERVFSVLGTWAGISHVIKQLEKHLEKNICDISSHVSSTPKNLSIWYGQVVLLGYSTYLNCVTLLAIENT